MRITAVFTTLGNKTSAKKTGILKPWLSPLFSRRYGHR